MRDVVPQWFLFLLIGNTAVTLAYSIWNLLRGNKAHGSWGIRACIMLLCPLAGVGYFLLSWLLYRLFPHDEADLSDVIFSKERVQTVTKADEELESNFVPMEEALAVTDRRHLRELMLNIVRGDYRDSLPSIALALNSSDSETSHYAATILQEALNNFRIDVQKDYREIMDALEQPEQERESSDSVGIHAAALIEFMDEMLQNHVFTQLEQAHYTHLMDAVGEKLYDCRVCHMDSGLLEKIALRLLEIQDYSLCEKWCLRIVELYPDTLSAFTTRLKLYFSNGEWEKFLQVMEQLKKSDITVDQETLNLIRTFS